MLTAAVIFLRSRMAHTRRQWDCISVAALCACRSCLRAVSMRTCTCTCIQDDLCLPVLVKQAGQGQCGFLTFVQRFRNLALSSYLQLTSQLYKVSSSDSL